MKALMTRLSLKHLKCYVPCEIFLTQRKSTWEAMFLLAFPLFYHPIEKHNGLRGGDVKETRSLLFSKANRSGQEENIFEYHNHRVATARTVLLVESSFQKEKEIRQSLFSGLKSCSAL